jgi:hypothetical protein
VVVYGGQRGWPYFFMDVDSLGLGVIGWYLALLTIQIFFWLALLGLDKLKQGARLRYKGVGGEGGGSGLSTQLHVVSGSAVGVPATSG